MKKLDKAKRNPNPFQLEYEFKIIDYIKIIGLEKALNYYISYIIIFKNKKIGEKL